MGFTVCPVLVARPVTTGKTPTMRPRDGNNRDTAVYRFLIDNRRFLMLTPLSVLPGRLAPPKRTSRDSPLRDTRTIVHDPFSSKRQRTL